VTNVGYPGNVEFYWGGNMGTGRIWIDYYSKLETLAEILFDLQTGRMRFTRAAFDTPYSVTLSRNRIEGSFVYQGSTYSCEARRP
jgi:hypothetical protein